tara:strand:+ start:639 stop:1820 length:1182 start_codon:yes stop_codon:yes gene_type:complete
MKTFNYIKWVTENKRRSDEDVLGSSEPIGLSDLPSDLAKTAATKGSGEKPDAVNAAPGGGAAQALKPSQKQIILVKAFNMAMNTTPVGGKFEPGGDIGAIISKDNFIMDGHHRWASTILVDPKLGIWGEKIDMVAKDLITALNVYTKGVLGKSTGNPGAGAISQFTGENIQSQIIDIAEKTGKSPDHPDVPGYEWEDLKQRITKLGGGDYAIGLNSIKENASIISGKEIESWMPDRSDMPVIQKDELPDVEAKFKAGELDLKPPFDQSTTDQMKKAGLSNDNSEPEAKTDLKESKLRNKIKKVIKEMIDANDYGSATLTTQGPGRSRFTKTGRPPGIMEDEIKYVVMGGKGEEGFQYGGDYNTEKEAQASADRRNNNMKYKKAGISFTVQEKN